MISHLLEGVRASGARVAILDITGVRAVDEQVAGVLVNAAQAVRLLGAEVVITGIRSGVAQALVRLGAELHGMVTRRNLQDGIAYSEKLICSHIDGARLPAPPQGRA